MKNIFQRMASSAELVTQAATTDEEALALEYSAERKRLIQRLQSNRQATVLVYVNLLGAATPAESLLRYLFEHLRSTGDRLHDRVALLVFTRPGAGSDVEGAHRELDQALRTMALLREHAREVEVLIPSTAFGPGTLLALGADRMLMHPLGTLGCVRGADQLAAARDLHRMLGESGLTEPAEKAPALLKLLEEAGAVRLGEARHLLCRLNVALRELVSGRVHRRQDAQNEALFEALVDHAAPLAHPIDRRRAKDPLSLPVESMDPDLEAVLWELFSAYEFPLRLHGGDPGALRVPSIVIESASLCHCYVPGLSARESKSRYTPARDQWVRLVETPTQ